jgi:hypothetical protein
VEQKKHGRRLLGPLPSHRFAVLAGDDGLADARLVESIDDLGPRFRGDERRGGRSTALRPP